MADNGIAQLIKSVPVLEPDDTVRRAAGLIRASEGSRVFVHQFGRISGSVSERAIVAFLAGGDDGRLDSPIEQLVESDILLLNSEATLREAAGVFASTEHDVLPVIDNSGSYRGAVYRRDVVGVLTRNLRPPTVAGMATPLGVYLTTGSVSGVANNLGLFLTGMSLAAMMAVAQLIVLGLQNAVSTVTGIPLRAFLGSPPLTFTANVYDLALYISVAVTAAVFLVLLRLSPLSGYHAAEHMTVHAIEVGETLKPENVARMPRVHARCGTNLLAAAGVFLIITSRFSGQIAVLFAMLVVVAGWRMVGAWLQYFVTTKRPSERQLSSGVAAGNQLLERYQEKPSYQATGLTRMWNLGFVQTLTGLASALLVMQYVFSIPLFL